MKRNLRNRIYVVVLIALFLLVTVPVYVSFQSSFYQDLKPLKSYHKTWQASTHNKMNCIDCHVRGGARSWLNYELRSFILFYLRFFSSLKNTKIFTKPSKQTCQKCHTKYRTISPSGDLLIPHQAHVEILKLECAYCHKWLVHKENPKGLNSPFMGGCLKCHDGKKATNQCKSCHTEKAYPESHRASNWLEIHSSKKHEINCAKCHAWTPDFCKECHQKRPPSHAGNWKKLHSGRAKISTRSCVVCHNESKCALCHDKPRASEFIKRAKKGKE